MIKFHLEHNINPANADFLVIDYTTNVKDIRTKTMEGLDFHHYHSEGKSCWSHCVVTSNFVGGPYSIPIHFKPYYREEKCKELNLPFQSKIDIAKRFIQDFIVPSNVKQLYILTDNWHTSNSLIEASLSKGYYVIGRMKLNITFSPFGINIKLSKFIDYLDHNILDVVAIKDN